MKLFFPPGGAMKKLLLLSLFSVIILAAATAPAEARIVVGLSPENPIADSTQLTNILSQELNDNVQLRSFDDNAALINWLLRFQELDAAVVNQSFIKQQPAGTLRALADLHKKSTPSPAIVVVRSNLDNNKATTLKKTLLALGSTDAGRKALSKAGISGFTLPGKALKRKAVKPEPALKKPAQKAPTKTTAVKSQPETIATPTEVSAAPKAKEPPPPSQAEKTVAVKPEKKAPPKPTPTIDKKTLSTSSTETTKQDLQPEEKAAAPVKKEVTKKTTVTQKTAPFQQPGQKKPEAEETSSSKRLILFIALVILVAILLKLTLLFMRWQSSKRITAKPAPPPFVEPVPEPEAVSGAVPNEQFQESEPLIVETGYIGPGKVPALLKRCADLPEPVVLQVTKGSCEKLIYFAGGQVSGAMTQSAAIQESDIRWSKLGNMLLREEFITVEERDQAFALLSREPDLRFGEALLKLGYISLAELRHALTRQAKITIYSLILFPEGKYKIFAEEGSLPPEESVSLEVTNLIREASHHQSEWMAIRQALPNLNTALNFTPEGREKLEQVNLSPQQEEMLSLINGKRTINELGVESTMMDYEVYRFLYLMVKAGVLQ